MCWRVFISALCVLLMHIPLYAQTDTTEGKYRTYYTNGKPQVKGSFRESKRHGIWKYFDEKGDLVKQERYRKGEVQVTRYYVKRRVVRIVDKKGHEIRKPACGCT